MKLQELFSDESKWAQGDYVQDAQGKAVTAPRKANAYKWCILGGIYKCYLEGFNFYIVLENVHNYSVEKGYHCTAAWNDAPERTFADIRTLMETLDI